MKRQDGFTLVEILVVILVIAILAAIAIPVFLRQRQRSYETQSRSALKNAATAAESYGTENEGDFAGLNGDDGTMLQAEGYKASSAVSLSVAATSSKYCLTATHALLRPGDDWKVATYNSDGGSPTPTDVDTCP